ncbi:hypothetical protein TNCV_4259531 [Trichonephila clavipes]|nr:hypothetical protein TNCV_4259531 [Trichonephila clavipes]
MRSPNGSWLGLFRAIDAVIYYGNELLQLAEIFPSTSSKESYFSLFVATEYLIEANSSNQLCALNSEIPDANEALIT